MSLIKEGCVCQHNTHIGCTGHNGQGCVNTFTGLVCEAHMGEERDTQTEISLPKLSRWNEERLAQHQFGFLDVGRFIQSRPVPFKNLLEVNNVLPYGHQVRRMVNHLAITGCRPSELDIMRFNGENCFIKGNVLFWRCGKNQKGKWRRVSLPYWHLRELYYGTEVDRTRGDRMFGISSETLRRYFNRDVRPLLSSDWQERMPYKNVGRGNNFILELKGIRKTYGTWFFKTEWDRLGSPHVALELTCAEMEHNTTYMTLRHYLRGYRQMDLDNYKGMTIGEILGTANQRHLVDFDKKLWKDINDDNKQKRMQEWF